ncbi:MAG: glutamate-5-semialdehyde dehydrogenase [Candidatus Omnitrophota bacterium]|jgi:glutamate-5-semialdehyde dehydrogenase
MSIRSDVVTLAAKAQEAYLASQGLSSDVKNQVLRDMASDLVNGKRLILDANKKDIRTAAKMKLSPVMIDRLTLNDKRIEQMANSLIEIVNLPNPAGEIIKAWRRPNGLWIQKVRVPIGVIAIIYESRPNVTSDCVGLCFKSGNSVILRGGSESIYSNLEIYKILQGVLKQYKIPAGMVSMVTTTDREAVDELLKLTEYIDLVIPRGGEELIKKVAETSRIPVIKHYKGICHAYVDKYADVKMAEKICFNAKIQRPGVCNAMESLLVQKDIAARFLPPMVKMFKEAGVQIRGCPASRRIVKGIQKAEEADYRTEYLDLILSLKVVSGLSEAITHINTYGSHHSDSIITENYENALEFLRQVDSACVYVNASTRFTDGYQFGMGAEIGISTDKIHARGPMALEELTTYKYMVFGNGQIRP